MRKRNKSNLKTQAQNIDCAYTGCAFERAGECTHERPIIYTGLGGICRSFRPADAEGEKSAESEK